MTTADLVLFDLDNTLLSGDSDFEWAQFLIAKGLLARELQEARNLEFYRQYQAGTLDIHAFLDFQLQPLARHPRTELDAWHAEFMATRIRPMIGSKATALVRRHAQAGALSAIVTATNSFVTAPIARELGIPHLIATVPEQDAGSGRYSGQPRGVPYLAPVVDLIKQIGRRQVTQNPLPFSYRSVFGVNLEKIQKTHAKRYGKGRISHKARDHMGNKPVALQGGNQRLNFVGGQRSVGHDDKRKGGHKGPCRFDLEFPFNEQINNRDRPGDLCHCFA